MSAQVELWRVSTAEGVFEADLETLKQWISEGCVLPTDKVSKGSLNWIDAGRAPMLKTAFSGERVALAVALPCEPTSVHNEVVRPVETPAHAEPDHTFTPPMTPDTIQPLAGVSCHNHPGVPPVYICRMGGEVFCKECARIVRGVTLCPVCGDLCMPYEQVKVKAINREFQTSGFGIEDFARAVRYPFQHKVTLLFGALAYGLLLLGGFRTGVIAYVIMFGCMSHVISQVAWGRLNRSFMPDFSEFSMWDDLVQPIFLGLGITIVTWGPVIVLLIALFFGVMNSVPRVSALAAPGGAAEQQGPSEEDLSVILDPNSDPEKLEEANKELIELRPGAELGREAEQQNIKTIRPRHCNFCCHTSEPVLLWPCSFCLRLFGLSFTTRWPSLWPVTLRVSVRLSIQW